jgi:hypothetical protein
MKSVDESYAPLLESGRRSQLVDVVTEKLRLDRTNRSARCVVARLVCMVETPTYKLTSHVVVDELTTFTFALSFAIGIAQDADRLSHDGGRTLLSDTIHPSGWGALASEWRCDFVIAVIVGAAAT